MSNFVSDSVVRMAFNGRNIQQMTRVTKHYVHIKTFTQVIIRPWPGAIFMLTTIFQASSPKLLAQSKPYFNGVHPWVSRNSVSSGYLGHVTKMAAVPIYGKLERAKLGSTCAQFKFHIIHVD